MTITVTSGELRLLTDAEKKGSYKWMVVTEFRFTDTDFEGRGITSDAPTTRDRSGSSHYHVRVPAGFLTDGASSVAPDWGNSWIFHDWLYAKHKFTSGQTCTREQADLLMRKVLKHERLTWSAWVFKRAASWGSYWFEKAWKSSGNRGAEFMEGFSDSSVHW